MNDSDSREDTDMTVSEFGMMSPLGGASHKTLDAAQKAHSTAKNKSKEWMSANIWRDMRYDAVEFGSSVDHKERVGELRTSMVRIEPVAIELDVTPRICLVLSRRKGVVLDDRFVPHIFCVTGEPTKTAHSWFLVLDDTASGDLYDEVGRLVKSSSRSRGAWVSCRCN